MRITITGTPGSGKGTLAKALAEKLGLKRYSIGDMRRKMALKKGLSLAELNRLGEEERWTDEEVDSFLKRLNEEDDVVVDARLGWFFIPRSFKIFLDADEEERARRMLARKRPEESFETLEEVVMANRERVESDKKRYAKYYGVNPYDKSLFDLVLDTTGKSPEETVREVLKALKHHKV